MEYSSDTENSDVTFINNDTSQGGTSRAPAGVGGARRRKGLPRRAWMNDGKGTYDGNPNLKHQLRSFITVWQFQLCPSLSSMSPYISPSPALSVAIAA